MGPVFQSQLIVCMHLLSHIANAFNFFFKQNVPAKLFPPTRTKDQYLFRSVMCMCACVCGCCFFPNAYSTSKCHSFISYPWWAYPPVISVKALHIKWLILLRMRGCTPVHILHLSRQPRILGRKPIFPAMPICNIHLIHSTGQFLMNVPQTYQFDRVATICKHA